MFSFSSNTPEKVIPKRCKNCIHFLLKNNTKDLGQCSCNFNFKFSQEECNTNKFNDIIDIRRCSVCFTNRKITSNNKIIYIDTQLGCTIDCKCNDTELFELIDRDILSNAKKKLKEIDFSITGEIVPIIFAEKINGKWYQLFELFEENYSKILFNKLQ